jgi:signal transduction histidine kinase/CheY-like chemotaxis protein
MYVYFNQTPVTVTIRKIIHYGQIESLSHTQNRKIFNVNFASLIAVLSVFIYNVNLLIYIGSDVALVNFVASSPFLLLYLVPLWLNYRHHHKMASWMMSLSITASVAFSIWVISGTYFDLHYYFILFAIAPLLFFSSKDWFSLLLLYFLNIGLFLRFEYYGIDTWVNINQPVDPESQFYLQASNIAVSLITLWFIAFLSERSAQHNEERLEKLLDKSKILQDQIMVEKENADAANKAKSRFLANMSHEIRTPLNGVIGFTTLLKNTLLTPVQQQYVDNANVSGHTLLGIINDILDFSKIEAGQMEVEMIKTDMFELVESSMDIFRFEAGTKHLELLLHIDPALPQYAKTDPVRLKQILTNLLGNAVKFTEKGEVELKITYEALSESKGKLSFSVRDTGIGITEEQQKKLFKAFSQADSSTTRKFGGSGLGLAISDLLVQKLGSKIHINSKQGEGTTFYFDIITDTEEGDRLEKRNSEEIHHYLRIEDSAGRLKKNPKLLIAEDVAINMLMLRAILKEMLPDAQLIEATDGKQVLKQYSDTTPDLIFMDVQMPEMDGIDATREIRRIEQNSGRHTPIIALTAGAFKEEMEICIAAGMDEFLTKPVEPPKIKGVIQKYLVDNKEKSE